MLDPVVQVERTSRPIVVIDEEAVLRVLGSTWQIEEAGCVKFS